MPRALCTPDEIQRAVSRRIHANPTVKEDAAKIGVPRPIPLAEFDDTGCNWSMEYFGNASGYEGIVREAVDHVQAVANLFPLELAARLERELSARLHQYELSPVWSDAHHLTMRNPSGKNAPFGVKLPDGYWQKFESASRELREDVLTNIVSAVEARYKHNSKAAIADSLDVDARVFDEH